MKADDLHQISQAVSDNKVSGIAAAVTGTTGASAIFGVLQGWLGLISVSLSIILVVMLIRKERVNLKKAQMELERMRKLLDETGSDT